MLIYTYILKHLKKSRTWGDRGSKKGSVQLIVTLYTRTIYISLCTQSSDSRHTLVYSWFHKKGTWSVNSVNGDYLSIPEGTGSFEYLFHEIPWKDIFARVSVKLEIFPDIFVKYWFFFLSIFPLEPILFSFMKNIRFRPFCIFTMYIKKLWKKNTYFFQKST